jgi:hypothetical protein
LNNIIVITTINEPTEAVEKFSKLPDFKLVVVGDKKTPRNWHCSNTVFLGADSPETAEFSLSLALPYNHYCRKMIGYLHAMKLGAEVIVDTDDDNIPKGDWAFPAFDGHFDHVSGEMGFINIYKHFTDRHIWPRGLPLRLINDKRSLEKAILHQNARVGVWQGLADEDPDVDAIYRLTSDAPCCFDNRNPIVLGERTITPFNSQNTMFRKELFSLLYLPAFVTFRFTDILRSLVNQPIMWLYGYSLGFTNDTVVQKRNPHDYFDDFLSEIPMYQHGEKVVELVQASISAKETIATNLRLAYASLRRNGIVPDKELKTLECWLKDIKDLGA